jgi:hypothetical protein
MSGDSRVISTNEVERRLRVDRGSTVSRPRLRASKVDNACNSSTINTEPPPSQGKRRFLFICPTCLVTLIGGCWNHRCPPASPRTKNPPEIVHPLLAMLASLDHEAVPLHLRDDRDIWPMTQDCCSSSTWNGGFLIIPFRLLPAVAACMAYRTFNAVTPVMIYRRQGLLSLMTSTHRYI